MRRLSEIMDQVSEYHPKADLGLIQRAYVFSAKAHAGQERLDGEPYLSHPLEVAGMLADMKLDVASIAAGLCHDTIEDTDTDIEEIKELFGSEIANIVEGATKISQINFSSHEERQAENMRKMILAMATDIRVLMVKLADRLHNMRTLGYLSSEKQEMIARETLDIYAPLASRLGIHKIQSELEDLSLFYLDHEAYQEIMSSVTRQRGERERFVREAIELVREKMEEFKIKGEVKGRSKHLYSIYHKMQDQNLPVSELYDVMGLRLIVDTVKDSYSALGLIHSMFKPVPGRFKDYISLPKDNGYQSLHSAVIGPHAERLEVQIRTREMHLYAENGIAAHWKYKGGDSATDTDTSRFTWLRSLLEWIQELKEPTDFLTSLKQDLSPNEVYVFTPAGDVKELPRGATPVDFAYSIHTQVGHQCTGAKVKGSIVPLKYQLQNGDSIEILTSKNHNPSRDWLNFVVTPRARNRIKQYFAAEERTEAVALGKEMLEKLLKRHDLNLNRLTKDGKMEEAAKEFSLSGPDDLFASIGFGKVTANQALGKIKPVEPETPSLVDRVVKAVWKKPKDGVKIRGVSNMLIRFPSCCSPLPGEPIMGYITQGRGVTIHSTKCQNAINSDPLRTIDVEWDEESVEEGATYPVHIQVISREKKGGLSELSGAISDANANISSATVETTPDKKGVSDFTVHVSSKKHLQQVVKMLKKLKNVEKVARIV